MAKIHKYIFNRLIAVLAIVFALGFSLSYAKKYQDYIFLFKDGKCIDYIPTYNVDSITFTPTIYLCNNQIYISEDCEYASLLFYCTPNKELSQSDVYWSSSDKSVATVKEGRVYPKGVGQCVISCNYGKQKLSCTVDVIPSETHHYVDLGLPSGTLWATSNLQSKSKYPSTLYLKFGELYGKRTGSLYGDSIITDQGFLRSGFDAASVYWGKDWRIPTYKEFEELLLFTRRSGDSIIGRNGNYIFLSKNPKFLRHGDYVVSNGNNEKSFFEPYAFICGYSSIKSSFTDLWDELLVRPVRNVKTDKVTVRVAYEELDMYDTDAPIDLHFNSSPFYKIPDSTVVWKSTDEKVATVESGVVTPYADGECEIIGEVGGLTVTTKVRVKSYKPTGSSDGYGYVDLGLPSGNKWAAYDLGSTLPDKIGLAYSWGDVVPDSYSTDDYETYRFHDFLGCGSDKSGFLNYDDIKDGWKCFVEAGVIDTGLVLTPNYDVATLNIGTHWKIPRSEDVQELLDNTKHRDVSLRGVEGTVFESDNGNGIFIPGKWHHLSDASKTTAGRVMGFVTTHLTPNPALNPWSVCYIRPIYVDEEITLPKVDSVYLKTTVLELNQSDKPTSLGFSCSNGPDIPASEATWETSDSLVATVKDGIVYPAQYINPIPVSECTITCRYKTFILTSKVILTRNKIDLSQPVDLGLPSGLMWSSSAIGASSVEEKGNEYVWGDLDFNPETDTKVKWEGKKYSELYELGVLDTLKNLTPEYDMAVSILGGNWRLPSKKEAFELGNNCIITCETINGVEGYLLTSKINNNSIFLPNNDLSGRNKYWTSTLSDMSGYANIFTFDEYDCTSYSVKMSGLVTIRPVYEKK